MVLIQYYNSMSPTRSYTIQSVEKLNIDLTNSLYTATMVCIDYLCNLRPCNGHSCAGSASTEEN